MTLKSKIAALTAVLALSAGAQAQQYVQKNATDVHVMSKEYTWPTDTAVLRKLDQWQDLKFGVLFHWGLYSVNGINESWPLCSEERFYQRRKNIRPDLNYEQFKQWYWRQSEQFNPTGFNPEDWASIMEDAGMKYLVFTTKHHEGFCMFDTKTTDFSIAKGPFRNNPRRDVALHVFNAFRSKGFMIGAYFSKPDWHCPHYWNPDMATPDRHNNYEISRHPEWWKSFQQYTAAQIEELTTRYGRIDILWLDGGQVRKSNGQDIRVDEIVDKARLTQPGMLAVDRTVPGRNENYATPEHAIPETQLDYPWESCIPITKGWGWRKETTFKSARTVINMLAEITAKGGSLLLDVGPTPQGTIEDKTADILHEVGLWLKDYGKAIYSTRTTPAYNDGNVWFTADKDKKTLYAIYTLPDGETLPPTIEWTGNEPKGSMRLLKGNKKVKYTCKDGKVVVTLPKGIENEPVAFRFNFD